MRGFGGFEALGAWFLVHWAGGAACPDLGDAVVDGEDADGPVRVAGRQEALGAAVGRPVCEHNERTGVTSIAFPRWNLKVLDDL